jgi:holo-[acyl-carrier protein] synthase
LSIRCGVDIIEIERVGRAWRKRPDYFLRRVFTGEEQRTLQGRPHRVKHLAARFAAKEAVFKLLGAGIGELSWTDVEIFSRPSGEPWVRLSGRAAERAETLSIGDIAVSLSHSREFAVAQAVAVCKD